MEAMDAASSSSSFPNLVGMDLEDGNTTASKGIGGNSNSSMIPPLKEAMLFADFESRHVQTDC